MTFDINIIVVTTFWSHSTCQCFVEHFCQAALSMLPLRLVAAGCLTSSVVLLRLKLRRDRHQRNSPMYEGYTVSNVKSQVFTSNIKCLPCPGTEPGPSA